MKEDMHRDLKNNVAKARSKGDKKSKGNKKKQGDERDESEDWGAGELKKIREELRASMANGMRENEADLKASMQESLTRTLAEELKKARAEAEL